MCGTSIRKKDLLPEQKYSFAERKQTPDKRACDILGIDHDERGRPFGLDFSHKYPIFGRISRILVRLS